MHLFCKNGRFGRMCPTRRRSNLPCCPGNAKHIRPGSCQQPLRAELARRAEKTFFFKKSKNNFKNLLTKPLLRDRIRLVPNGMYALVAQLDRVTDYESVGRGFESLPSHQKMP